VGGLGCWVCAFRVERRGIFCARGLLAAVLEVVPFFFFFFRLGIFPKERRKEGGGSQLWARCCPWVGLDLFFLLFGGIGRRTGYVWLDRGILFFFLFV
jgi:hypothetical protein